MQVAAKNACAAPSLARSGRVSSGAAFTRPLAPHRASSGLAARALPTKPHEEESVCQRLAVPVATVVTAATLLGAQMALPEQALAARSGGRVGSSAGFARRTGAAPYKASTSTGSSSFTPRAAPATRATTTTTTVHTTTVVAAPTFGFGMPMFGGFGMPMFGGWGFGGVRIFPVFPFGGFLTLMMTVLFAGVLFTAVRALLSAGKDNNSGSTGGKKNWDDL